MPNPHTDWRSKVASQVCKLVRNDNVRARFRALCMAFRDEKKRGEEQLAAWERQRKEHCLKGLHTLADLMARMEASNRLDPRDRKAIARTRPADDADKTWVHEYYHDFLEADDLARLGSATKESRHIEFYVWVPPNLCLSASPKLTVPPLFGRFGGSSAVPTMLLPPELSAFACTLHSSLGTTIIPGIASLAEKYASLAAIHDTRFPDRVPIEELHDLNRGPRANELKQRARDTLRGVVSSLPRAVEANVLAWLADVKADIFKHVEPLDSPSRTGSELGGSSKAA